MSGDREGSVFLFFFVFPAEGQCEQGERGMSCLSIFSEPASRGWQRKSWGR